MNALASSLTGEKLIYWGKSVVASPFRIESSILDQIQKDYQAARELKNPEIKRDEDTLGVVLKNWKLSPDPEHEKIADEDSFYWALGRAMGYANKDLKNKLPQIRYDLATYVEALRKQREEAKVVDPPWGLMSFAGLSCMGLTVSDPAKVDRERPCSRGEMMRGLERVHETMLRSWFLTGLVPHTFSPKVIFASSPRIFPCIPPRISDVSMPHL